MSESVGVNSALNVSLNCKLHLAFLPVISHALELQLFTIRCHRVDISLYLSPSYSPFLWVNSCKSNFQVLFYSVKHYYFARVKRFTTFNFYCKCFIGSGRKRFGIWLSELKFIPCVCDFCFSCISLFTHWDSIILVWSDVFWTYGTNVTNHVSYTRFKKKTWQYFRIKKNKYYVFIYKIIFVNHGVNFLVNQA